MKFMYLIIVLLVSFLLTSCDNDDVHYDMTDNHSLEENLNEVDKSVYQDFVKANEALASYSTPLGSSTDERINNLDIVCKRLNNFILKSGETFSYNDVCGPYGPSDGFEEATILLSDGTEDKGYGGGVCQLSSTLYNVVANIPNMEIVERHHHSTAVSYVPKNQDATVSLQSNLDFKFKNNNKFDVRFVAVCGDGEVKVEAYRG